MKPSAPVTKTGPCTGGTVSVGGAPAPSGRPFANYFLTFTRDTVTNVRPKASVKVVCR